MFLFLLIISICKKSKISGVPPTSLLLSAVPILVIMGIKSFPSVLSVTTRTCFSSTNISPISITGNMYQFICRSQVLFCYVERFSTLYLQSADSKKCVHSMRNTNNDSTWNWIYTLVCKQPSLLKPLIILDKNISSSNMDSEILSWANENRINVYKSSWEQMSFAIQWNITGTSLI